MKLAHLVLGALAAAALLSSATAQAATVFTGNSSAVFGTPTPSAGTTYSYPAPNDFLMGDADPDQNEYIINGLGFSTNNNAPFAVAGLSYHNGQTDGGEVTSVPVNFTLAFTSPVGIPNQVFNFTFNFIVTPNDYDPLSNPLNDDMLTINNLQANQTFNYGGQTYTLYLLGFGPDANDITSSFTLPEETTTTSTLWAELAQPNPVGDTPPTSPLPAAAPLGLTALGCLGAWRLIRRRRNAVEV